MARQINGSEWFFSDEGKAGVIAAIRAVIERTRAEVRAEMETSAASRERVAQAIAALRAAGVTGVSVSVGGLNGGARASIPEGG
jgi:hypothetical protein